MRGMWTFLSFGFVQCSAMPRTVRYLSHPQIQIDPHKAVDKWSLNDLGRSRVLALSQSDALAGTEIIISSAETKAVETATPIAQALGCPLDIRQQMHENDRSATGFLPPDEFETVADQFFKYPDTRIRGWETATSAQARIVAEVRECLSLYPDGDILFVGHGGVGTLLYCHLPRVEISRDFDQGAGGGGCFFEFQNMQSKPVSSWRPLEDMIAD